MARRNSTARDLLPEISKEKPWQPGKWTGVHRRIVALEMAGYKPGEIAQITGYSPNHISIILNDPRAIHDRNTIGKQVASQITDIHLKLRLHADQALETLVDSLNSEDEKVAQKGALAILDRAGYSKYQGEHIPKSVLPEGAAERILEAVAEIRALSPDQTYEVVEGDYKMLSAGEDESLDV